MLVGQDLTIDLTEYTLPPVDKVLGLLVVMAEGQSPLKNGQKEKI